MFITTLAVGFLGGTFVSIIANQWRTVIDENLDAGKIVSFRTLIAGMLSSLYMLALSFSVASTDFYQFAFFGLLLLALSLLDYDTMTLPDSLTQMLLWLGLLLSCSKFSTLSPVDAIWGATIGYMSLWLLNMFSLFVFKKQGMGHGDFKLYAAIGAWLGAESLISVMVVAVVFGFITAFYFIATSKHKNGAFPFGIGLASGAVVYVLYGDLVSYILNSIS